MIVEHVVTEENAHDFITKQLQYYSCKRQMIIRTQEEPKLLISYNWDKDHDKVGEIVNLTRKYIDTLKKNVG